MILLHKNKSLFEEVLNTISKETTFDPTFLEKDYYLTVILIKVNDLSKDLVFKGGTLLNKIYFPYHRISEDLDFSLAFRLPTKEEKKIIGFSPRKESLKNIERNIDEFMKQFDLIPTRELVKRDGSRQYNFEFGYNSVITNKIETIKFEIRSRDNNIVLPVETHPVKHKFINPHTNESLIEDGSVKTLSLKEALADKLAAAINRSKPRDFYDIDYAIRNNFNFADKAFIEVFKRKLQDDGNETDISKYKNNLGLDNDILMKVKAETPIRLHPVLIIEEQRNFDFDNALKRINKEMEKMIDIYL